MSGATMSTEALVRLLGAVGDVVADKPMPEGEQDREALLAATETVAYELVGYSEQIRAACERVNGTPRPVPVKPLRPKSTPPPPTEPPPARTLAERVEALEVDVEAIGKEVHDTWTMVGMLGRMRREGQPGGRALDAVARADTRRRNGTRPSHLRPVS